MTRIPRLAGVVLPAGPAYRNINEFFLGLPYEGLLDAWLFDRGVTLSGSDVVSWRGWKAGLAAQSDATRRPTFNPDLGGTGIGGIVKASSNDNLATPYVPWSEGYIALAIKTPPSFGASAVYVGSQESTGNALALGYTSAGLLSGQAGDKVFADLQFGDAMATSSLYVIGIHWTAAKAVHVRRNTVASTPVTFGGTLGNVALFMLGRSSSGAVPVGDGGGILGAAFYSGVTDADFRDSVDEDLALKIGLAL